MRTEFSEIEKNYLKRLAALQFPGSKDNYSTRHPIHFLQEQSDQYEKVSLSDFDEYLTDICLLEYYNCGTCETYSSIEELVCRQLDDFDPDDEEDVEAYNKEAEENGDPQFVPYEKAVDNGGVPGSDEYVGDVSDYLEVYGLEPHDLYLYRHTDAWNVKAVSFTHKGLLDVKKRISNHIFRPTRTYAFTTTDGDFPVLMGVLMKLSKELLNEEAAGLRWTESKVMSPTQVKEQYRETPNEEFCAATYNMQLPPQMTDDGKKHNVTLSVYASGEMRKWGENEYPFAELRVVLKDGNAEKHSEWPFECDGECRALLDDNKVILLLNYMRYI